jgi:hypothetical protein
VTKIKGFASDEWIYWGYSRDVTTIISYTHKITVTITPEVMFSVPVNISVIHLRSECLTHISSTAF